MAEQRTPSSFPAPGASARQADKALRAARATWPGFDRLDPEIQEILLFLVRDSFRAPGVFDAAPRALDRRHAEGAARRPPAGPTARG